MDLYSDCTGTVYAPDYKELISRQVCNHVRWQTIVENMAAAGIDTFIEVGPGKTLCGLIKKTLPEARTFAAGEMDGVRAAAEEM